MKTAKTLMVCSALAASAGLATVAQAADSSLTANAAVTNNYIWRGVTQTNDQAAVQGGIDYAVGGFGIGAWASNVDFGSDTANDTGTELDLYASYGFDFGDAGSLELGYIAYTYPSQEGSDFSEAYVSYGISYFTVGGYFTVDTDWGGQDSDVYLTAGAAFPVGPGEVSVTYGDYNYDDPASTDYSHWQLAFSKDEFTFAIDKNDLSGGDSNTNADDTRFSVMWSKEWDI
jgi:uncharacterized protein (TIGR02001 family)